MLIDVSQLSSMEFQQVLSLTKAPVAATHSGIKSIVNVGRNLSDEELELIRKNGGVVQIVAFSNYLRPAPEGATEGNPAPPATVAQLADSIDYAVKKSESIMRAFHRILITAAESPAGKMRARRKM
jgi:microsomal dipeptidase-like Zn-dependent dipeptidase